MDSDEGSVLRAVIRLRKREKEENHYGGAKDHREKSPPT